jgi:hypothetical protein
MKKLFTIIAFVISATLHAQTVVVSGNITTNTTWGPPNTYILSGFVYVKGGAELTILPGTIIKGEKSTKGSLIITRGSKIIADGTATQPIIFTSNEPLGARTYGDWGGLIILGNAPVNVPGGFGVIEGGVDNAAGDGQYGGNNAADNSGVLRYVRIEFPGIAFVPNSEINGLTFGAVGNQTLVDFVQVSYSGDDSFEWFGGTVNCKHLIAFRGLDDDFDTDFGFSGNVQFGIAQRDPNVADVSGSNGFESDNDATGTMATPFTQPIFSNITLVGPKSMPGTTINPNYKRAAHLRRNTRCSIYNSILTGYPTGLFIDGTVAATETNAINNDLQIENNIVAGNDNNLTVISGSTFDITTWYNNPTRSNALFTNSSDILLQDPFNLSNPNMTPVAGSPALNTAAFTNARLNNSFFDVVSFKGAMDANDWTLGWTNFNPNTTTASVNESAASINAIYPNPVTNQFQLILNLIQSDKVTVSIYDINGKLITSVFSEQLPAGTNKIQANTETLDNGIYMVHIQGSSFKLTQRITIVK